MDRKRSGYKTLRTTLVLAQHSNYMAKHEDPDVREALVKVEQSNYDFQRVAKRHMEVIYAYFDDAAATEVLGEYVFRPVWGHIRDLGECIGTCALCGKGDSKDTGDNEDKIRYEFLLTNMAGGTDVWCGSTCIINHHLKVDGAATSAEARKSLERAFREHKEEWRREAWRQAHPDHHSIPNLMEKHRRLPGRLRWNGPLHQMQAEIGLLGFSFAELEAGALLFRHKPQGDFKKAARYYAGNEYLTPLKMEAWRSAKKLAKAVDTIDKALADAGDIRDPEERIAFFRNRGETLRSARRKARALTEETDDGEANEAAA